jgi:hypothetical protein
MKVYKVNVNGLDYHVQLTEATAKEIGAVLVDSQKKPAAPAEKPAPTERKKPGPKPKTQTEQKEEKKG